MANVAIMEASYKDFGKCIKLSNGSIQLLVTVDAGPRIIRFGFCGEENELCEYNGLSKQVCGDTWKIRGGHRLWHSPEHEIRTYMPDNDPVEWKAVKNGIEVYQKTENMTGIKKEMVITMDPSSCKVELEHRIINKGLWPVELSAWAITMMAPGGRQIIPMPHRESGLLPNRSIALWPYSKMNDPRVRWGDKYIIFDQDRNNHDAFKLGIHNEDGWVAYINNGHMFIKRFVHNIEDGYPDFNSSYETYAIDYMMEMESLSPMTVLNPEDKVIHVENWELLDNVGIYPDNEDEIQALVDKYI